MALVDYSDSESEGEGDGSVTNPPAPAPAAHAVFQKAAPGKLQVNLPKLKPEPGQSTQGTDAPPAKRARTAGAFSGFNALLPAPKKPSPVKKGLSLKTSSEAAFSRNPPPEQPVQGDSDYTPATSNMSATETLVENKEESAPEPKLMGKNTRFLPLSVSGKKKKKPIPKTPQEDKARIESKKHSTTTSTAATKPAPAAESPKPKVKQSLFSVSTEEESLPTGDLNNEYESITAEVEVPSDKPPRNITDDGLTYSNPNSLASVAEDMNLTPAQRRQLFGRGDKGVNVMHFNLDAQYRENERARQAGEVVEHRAVKAVAAGKHSLQQLVNNARSQQEGLQDKWAEGRRNRGEGGSKYGWG